MKCKLVVDMRKNKKCSVLEYEKNITLNMDITTMYIFIVAILKNCLIVMKSQQHIEY